MIDGEKNAADIAEQERAAERLIREGQLTITGEPIASFAGLKVPTERPKLSPPAESGERTTWSRERTAWTCKATKADGAACSLPAITNTGYCFVHDPDKERKRQEEERCWDARQWLRGFAEQRREDLARLVAMHTELEYRRREYGVTPPYAADVANDDAVSNIPNEIRERFGLLHEALADDVATQLFADQAVLDRAELEQAAVWNLRDTPEGADNPFNQAVRSWSAGEVTNEGVAPMLLSSFAGILARMYLERASEGAGIEALREFWSFVRNYDEPGPPPKGRTDRERRRRNDLPTAIMQQTFQEMRSIAVATADGPSFRRWEQVQGEIALRHVIPDQPHQIKLVPNARMVGWLPSPMSYAHLEAELQSAGLPAALLEYVAVGIVLQQGRVTITLDELARYMGLVPRSSAERKTIRREIYRWLVLLSSMAVIGQRPGRYRDPHTREELELISRDPLVLIAGERFDKNASSDDPPIDVTIDAGAYLDEHRGNHQVLPYLGNVRKIASIAAGKPSGAWAQSIALALHQRWRERAHDAAVGHVGDGNHLVVRFDKPFTREDLLDLFRAEPYFRDVLEGPHPKRAQTYWEEAISLLRDNKQNQIIGYYKALKPLPTARQGWQKAWLAQPLDIRPAGDDRAAVAEIATRTTAAKRVRKQRKQSA